MKLTYAEALRNLEHISDEIHTRRRNSSIPSGSYAKVTPKRISLDSNESLLDDAQELINMQDNGDDLTPLANDGGYSKMELYRCHSAGTSPITPNENPKNPLSSRAQSNEWIEISLENSSPEDDLFYKSSETSFKHPLTKQMTLPNPMSENEFSSIKNKIKLDSRISNWISRSSATNDENASNGGEYKNF